jgi:hypothetical protein
MKAQAIDSLVKQFATAASAEVGMLVKSTGAVEVGLSIFGMSAATLRAARTRVLISPFISATIKPL